MYSAQPNGADSATINPAALASDTVNASRGVKRSRSPETYQDTTQQGTPGDDEGDKPRKRGRPMKPSAKPINETPIQPPTLPAMSSHPPTASSQLHSAAHQAQQPQPPRSYIPPPMATPSAPSGPVPVTAPPPTQTSPPVKTPAKTTIKALPTVRDHTTDQLGPGNDEYLPRETDEAGEKKVLLNGQLLGGREYRCRTFLVPQRGDKLFMLATECARVLGYRDSYLLFNKNRSLYKIIANQVEKDDLVGQEILPFSYRSRQIAIVTARSMFRQFGSRVIVGGRRVRDDYWETKARKQGFTEADMAGEKRPGGTKAREAAAEAAAQSASIVGPSHGEIVYANTPQFGAAPPSQLVQPEYNDTRSRDYSSILKTAPRQEITGPAYQDRSQPAPISEIHAQAHHAAEFNRGVNQQRDIRNDYMQNVWRRPHEQPPPPPSLTQQQVVATEPPIQSSRAGTSSHPGATASGSGMPQPALVSHQSPQMMMTAAPYSQPISAQSSLPSSIQRSSGSMSQQQGYSYPPSTQMWPPTPQTPHTPQYSYSHPPPVQPAHPQQPQPPQLRHSSGSGPVQQGNLPYSAMPGINPGYPSQNQPIAYDQTPRQYLHQPGSGSPAVTQGWSGQPQQWWTNQQ